MHEELFALLSCPLAAIVGAIFIKFITFGREAREEEFASRKKAVALAGGNGAKLIGSL